MTSTPDSGISRRAVLKLLAAAAAGAASSAAAAQSKPSDSGPTLAAGHPRLFYNSAALRRLKEYFAQQAPAATVFQQRLEALLAATLVPEATALIGGGQQANYGQPANQIADMGITLGLAFQLTGDERYARKLRDALVYYAAYEHWAGPQLKERTPPWHSVLETSRFCFGYAAGYDALHDWLTSADRKVIVDGMLRLGALPLLDDWILPGKRIHSFDTMGHNWWGVCVAGAGIAALAVIDELPEAAQWVSQIDQGFSEWFDYRGNVLQNRPATFERSGPSYESVGYTSYGVNEYLRYRFAWQNVFPGRTAAHMKPLDGIATFFLHTLYPTSTGHLCVDFNDSALTDDVSETVLLLIACGLGSSAGTRYLQQTHTHAQYAFRALLELHSPPDAGANPPHSCIYPEMGWALMRSSWENNATLLAMKSGFTWNHAHADAGTFLIFHQGVPLIIDSGTCSYGRKEYSTYYRQSRAHNVILVDGQGQPEDDIMLGCKFPGHMHSLVDTLGLKYAYADATGPMARWLRRNYRHWLWSGDVLLIFDDVLAFSPARVDWLLHYAGEFQPRGAAAVSLRNGAAAAEVTMLYPPATLRKEQGLADHKPDQPVEYLVFSTADSSIDHRVLTAICLDPANAPRLELLQDKDYLGVRVTSAAFVEETYFNLRSKSGATGTFLTVDGWETDASLFQVRKPLHGNTVDRCFVSDGSYFRRAGRSLLESLGKVSVCWAPAPGGPLIVDSRNAAGAENLL